MSSEGHAPPGNLLLAFGAAVVATGVFAAWLGWQIGGERSVLYVSDAGTILAPFVACAACIRAARRHENRMRTFWWLLGAACGAWMLGEMIWTFYDLTGSGGPPIPSLADVGYLTFIPLAVGALLWHPGLQGSGVRKARSLFDSLAIAVALLFLSWTFVLGPLWQGTDLTTLGGIVTLAYPFGDVVIAFFVMLALRRMETADRLGLWCIFAGLIAMAFADSTYAYVVEVKSYTTGNLLDTGWFAAFLGIALGARASNIRDLPARRDSSLLALPSLVAPLLPVFIALSVAGISIKLEHRPDPVAVTMLIALILLALARQTLLVLDVARASGGEQRGNLVDRLSRVVLGRPISAVEGGEP
jgi:hypothetical protein